MRHISVLIFVLVFLLLFGASASEGQTRKFEGKWPAYETTEEMCQLADLYIDIPRDYWAKQPIEELAKIKIMEGFRDFTFRPERIVTRAELAVLIVRAKGMKLQRVGEDMFWDIRSTSWVAPYIAVVVNNKYMIGYPDGAFRPRQMVSRAEAAVTLARAFDLFQDKCEADIFPDISRQHWACEAIDGADKAGLLKYLANKNFEPAVGLTRAEAAEIISKIPAVRKRIDKALCKE